MPATTTSWRASVSGTSRMILNHRGSADAGYGDATADHGRQTRSLHMAFGQRRVRENQGSDRSGRTAFVARRRSADHPVPDLYQGGGDRDAEPPVQAPRSMGHVGR